jgi:hypothetical protein
MIETKHQIPAVTIAIFGDGFNLSLRSSGFPRTLITVPPQ